jgi:AraC-like DNA-binding protein
MLDTLYDFFRSSSGLALMVVGIETLVERGRNRVRAAFGALFLAVGAAFVFSWISGYALLPLPVDNLVVIAIVFAISQAFFEICLYLFGDEARRGTRRRVYVIGAAWSAVLWVLPFIDAALGLSVVRVSIEDARPMALFQSITSFGIYAWPIAISIISLRAARWHPADLPRGPGAVRALLVSLATLIAILSTIGAAVVAGSRPMYRFGHGALELNLIAWCLAIRAYPDVFVRARHEIGAQHKKRLELGPGEAASIDSRLEALVSGDRIFVDPDISLQSVAKATGIPAYRLSAYFNAHRGATFSDWLNTARIDYIKARLAADGDATILDIAFDAGYASKAVFNTQFRRRVGMTPSEFRRRFVTP